MKNTIKMKAILRIAGIIAIIAVIGFSMGACNSGGGGGGGGSSSATTTSSSGSGGFTITGIPSQYSGMSAMAMCYSLYDGLFANGATGSGISNGKISIPLYKGYSTSTKYTGNDEAYYVAVTILNTKTQNMEVMIEFDFVQFKNGNATVSWKEGDIMTDW